VTATATRRVLQLAAAVNGVDEQARTITGLAVPYGPVGHSSVGPVTFAQGSITLPAQVGRIKLLEQHDPERPLGYATKLTDTPEGLLATFHVPEGAAGDEALAMAADGRRDGLSVGVALDAATWDALVERMWSDEPDEPVPAAGELLEVSHVTIPAFADARVDGSPALAAAAGDTHRALVTFDRAPTDRPALAGAHREDTTMECNICGQVHAAGVTTCQTAPAQLEASAGTTATATGETPAPRPPANHEAARVSREPVVYSLDGTGPSLVRDAYLSRFDPMGNAEAVARFTRFQTMASAGHEETLRRLTAAVETRSTLDNYVHEGWRPDMLIAAIDKGRPIVSRVGTVTLTDATPYRLPVEGEFSGIADHTEGTAHAPEGDLTADDVLVEPGAVSGAYRLSRELIDSSNPALDRIALAAMGRDYRRVTEAKANAALEASAPASAAATTTVEGVSVAIDAFFDANTEQPDELFTGSSFYSTLRQDVDGTGRPMLARVGSTNANGTITAGGTGAEVDGVELVRAYSVDAAAAYLLANDALHIGESAIRTFRFEEVEGPGVVKLALWAYFVAKVIRPAGVVRLATTDETP
jgi:HK97 family phage prohead protease